MFSQQALQQNTVEPGFLNVIRSGRRFQFWSVWKLRYHCNLDFSTSSPHLAHSPPTHLGLQHWPACTSLIRPGCFTAAQPPSLPHCTGSHCLPAQPSLNPRLGYNSFLTLPLNSVHPPWDIILKCFYFWVCLSHWTESSVRKPVQ